MGQKKEQRLTKQEHQLKLLQEKIHEQEIEKMMDHIFKTLVNNRKVKDVIAELKHGRRQKH
jgi:hypothetical protein